MTSPNTPPKSKPVNAPIPDDHSVERRRAHATDQSQPSEINPADRALAPGGSVIDRRMWPDRRANKAAQGNAQAQESSDDFTGLERRRGVGRRLSDFTKRAEEGELTKEQFMFLMAIEAFKKANDRQFPTWTDVLEVVRLLGYRKTMATELTLRNAEDWLEIPTAPANVRPQRWHERHAKAKRDAA